ncbi:MAG TPA: MBL fold metallo-hydrolase [Gemmataceae bacterium]|jgi:glyoxylase-like metal-dependent hydrolase (beta-lactamase superfamily II)|nr:MBL fold metallo-hydrolase [Gemmataceae bacterium]
MATIPLEDNFTDIIGKAQRGFKLSDEELAKRAEISLGDLQRVKSGDVDEQIIRLVARSLNLGKSTLVESAKKAWYPKPISLDGLVQFNTPYQDMTVNSYLVSDPQTEHAIAFDTGADCGDMLEFAKANHLPINLILLTHTHPDHIADLARLKGETGAPAFVCDLEPTSGAETFSASKSFELGSLKIETRQTSGHSVGGITYVVSGLARKVAIVGDAIFAGSMGGGGVSYLDALGNNRKKIMILEKDTVLCPGHGPLTTVGEEQLHNPFFPEFQKA